MATFPDPRRNTPAANADILGEDASYGPPPGKPAQADGSNTARGGDTARAGRTPTVRREANGEPESGDARAGRDINQAGFVKDSGEGKP
jgi:hypothetical protein